MTVTSTADVKSRMTGMALIGGVFLAALTLAGCGGGIPGIGGGGDPFPPQPQQQAPVAQPAGAPSGQTIGTGQTRVAIILPLTQGG